jgi:hypothetical protein
LSAQSGHITSFRRIFAALLVVAAAGALSAVPLWGKSGAVSAAYDYCDGPYTYTYQYCPPPRIPAHFKAYQVDQATPVHATESVVLTDRFGTETVQVSSVRLLLTPVEKRRQSRPAEPIQRPEEHQVCYAVSGGASTHGTVRVTNQFETGTTLRVDGPSRLCAPASKSLTGPPTVPPADTQHYKCYAVGQPQAHPEEIVDLVDQFRTERVGVRAAALYCLPTAKKRVNRPLEPAPRPDEDLVCYALRRIQTIQVQRPYLRDQFVSQRVRVKAPLYLCVPSTTLP